MKQLKMKHLVSLGVAGTLSAITTVSADVDTTISSQTTNASDEQQREAYEDFVSQLRSTYTWVNQIDEPFSGDYRAKRKELERERYTMMQIELLRGKLLALKQQVAQSGNELKVTEDHVKTVSELRDKHKKFETELAELMDILESTGTVRADTTIKNLIRDTNMDIEKFAQINNHFEDGIVGNMDAIKRLAHSSRQSNTVETKNGLKSGIDIDTSATDRANFVTSQVVSLDTEVSDVTTAIDGRKSVLSKISEVQKTNELESVKAGVYRDNVEANIKIINDWLKSEYERPKVSESDIERYKSQLDSLVENQSNANKIFDEIEKSIQSSKHEQSIKDKLGRQLRYARNKMVGSINLTGEHIVDFGDIGRTPFEIRQELDKMKNMVNPKSDIDEWNKNVTGALEEFKSGAVSGIESGKLPNLNIQPLSHVIRALGIGDFKAVAHTDGDYSVKKVSGSLSIKGDGTLMKSIAVPVLDLPSTKKPATVDDIGIKNPTTGNIKPLTNLSVRRFGVGNGFTVRYLNKRR